MGAWFEAQIKKVTKTAAAINMTGAPSPSSSSCEDGVCYHVVFDE